MQEHIAENNHTASPLPCIKNKQVAAKIHSKDKQTLTDNCSIHTFELEKWHRPDTLQATDFWLYFFKEAKHWKALPDILLAVPELRLAMKTLEQFSEREAENHLYQSRQDAIRVQLTQQAEYQQIQENLEKAEVKNKRLDIENRNLEAQKKRVQAQNKQAQAEATQAHAEATQAQAENKQAQAEIAKLHEILKQAGLDPNDL